MKKLFSFSLFFILILPAYTQYITKAEEDSTLKAIDKLTTDKEKAKAYKKLAERYLGADPTKEEIYLSKALFVAEQSRDRDLIGTTTIDVVDQYLDMGGIAGRQEKAISIIEKGVNILKETSYNNHLAILSTKKAYIFRSKLDYPQALKYNQEAANYAELSNIDSIKFTANVSWANTLAEKDETLPAFKKYIAALTIAEEMDNANLKMNVYKRLADFYYRVEQIEKTKDYYAKVIKIAKELKDENAEMDAYSSLILLLGTKKDFLTAREYLNIFKEKASKSKNDFIRNRAMFNEVNLLFLEDETKVANYMRNNPAMLVELGKMGYAAEVDKAFGIMYSLEKRNDSAMYYFKAAKAKFKPNESPTTIIGYNSAYAGHLERNGDYKGAAKVLEENLQMALNAGSLSGQKAFREELDSLYIKAGNKQMEITNKLALYTVKDSLEKQQKAKDLINIELDAENKRLERETKIKEEKLRNKHNLQYMGITAGILTLFVLLAALGRFKVRPWLIRALGFFSFILLFEFIILLADKEIHHITHGDPLQILLIKIVLIAILLPLHHWLEHKAIHYLLRHQHKSDSVSNVTH